jgi:DNA-binding transcriptional LysR family regulator
LLASKAPEHEDANLDLKFLTFNHMVPIVPPSPPALTSEAKVLNKLPLQRKTMYEEGNGGRAYAEDTNGTLHRVPLQRKPP